jgi:tetratricopeptide (TPR) repeat protein
MAMLGGTANTIIRGLNFGRNGKGDQVLGAWSQGAKWGSLVGDAMWAYTNASNPITGAVTFGALGLEAFKKLDLAEFAERFGKKLDAKGAAAIGAGIGIGVSLIRNSDFDLQKTFGKWQPKKYKEITEMNEYFDRLEYIKYKGLYEVAARRAALLEGTNVKAVFKDLDKNKKKIAKLQRKAQKLLDKYDERDHEYINRINKINQEISSLREDEKIVFKGGKYTKSAIAYKKAMESTIYGLSEGATKDEILAAVPDQYKDYFQRFMNETDESERKKILKHLPDYLKRPLQAAWGHKMENVKSNNRYFQSHKLPGVTWRGWKPNINLRHVQMKTVQNEGMLLADFGFYESEKGKAAYEIAPDIENYDQQGFSMFQSIRLAAELKGFGLNLTDVNIDRTTTPGMWIGADIKQTLNERTELATNSVTNAMQSLVSNFI